MRTNIRPPGEAGPFANECLSSDVLRVGLARENQLYGPLRVGQNAGQPFAIVFAVAPAACKWRNAGQIPKSVFADSGPPALAGVAAAMLRIRLPADAASAGRIRPKRRVESIAFARCSDHPQTHARFKPSRSPRHDPFRRARSTSRPHPRHPMSGHECHWSRGRLALRFRGNAGTTAERGAG